MIQILIVDDEKPICDLIQMSLTRAGYRCTCVYDGLAAADILERNVFDLILLDVMLPNADGFELMEYIRPLGIPVIFLTARGSVDDRVRGLRMGAEDYIVKPFEVLELLARVEIINKPILYTFKSIPYTNPKTSGPKKYANNDDIIPNATIININFRISLFNFFKSLFLYSSTIVFKYGCIKNCATNPTTVAGITIIPNIV